MSTSSPILRRLLWTALLLSPSVVQAASAAATISLPDFPLPTFARDRYGAKEELSSTRLLRELQKGGVHGLEHFEAVDSDYAVVSSASLSLLSAWLEAACRSLGVDVAQARKGTYNGAAYARLLGIAVGIAAARKVEGSLAVPVGVMVCRRKKSWGVLPGDGERDAYVVVATERGILVYDPPTRQTALLTEHPNNSEVVMIVF